MSEDAPIQAIEHPIICSPWAEPTHHWLYSRDDGHAYKAEGRRPAGFYTPQSQSQRDIRRGQAEMTSIMRWADWAISRTSRSLYPGTGGVEPLGSYR